MRRSNDMQLLFSRWCYSLLYQLTACIHRPSLLLAEQFADVPAAKEALLRLFPDADIDAMVEQQPLLLVEDIELAVSELKRYVKASRESSSHV